MKKIFLSLAWILFVAFAYAQNTAAINIIPQPQSFKPGTGHFQLSESVPVVSNDASLRPGIDFFTGMVHDYYGLKLNPGTSATSGKSIRLSINKNLGTKAGGYTLTVSPSAVSITGVDKEGVFHGLQSLFQLIPASGESYNIPAVTIRDEPRFGYRGIMIDVCRHFQPIENMKKIIDRMALLKFNTLHWHLTEDQGWRLEIKKYPLLTEVGAWRDGTIIGRHPGTGNTNERYGGYYTQDEARELVKYAQDRNITIIPEIEMPGHSSAAIAAYPYLSSFPNRPTDMGKNPSKASQEKPAKKVQETWGVFDDIYVPTEQTFQFLEDVIDEVVEIFPSTYIHIGGDEAPKTFWKESAFAQQLIKEKNLKDEHGLQSYFIQRMEKYINSKGRKIIGWDEILEGGLAPNATVMSWRGEAGGVEAAKQGHDVIMTPTSHAYLDYDETRNEDSLSIGGYIPLERVYNYDPVPRELRGTPQAKHVLGAQANLWTEYIDNLSKLEYKLFPRAMATAEAAWTEMENKNWENFQRRLPHMLTRWDKLNTNYSRGFYGLNTEIKKNAANNGLVWLANSKMPGSTIEITGPDGKRHPATATGVALNADGTWYATLKKDGKVMQQISQPLFLNKATGRKITLNTPPSPNWSGPDKGNASALVNGLGGTTDVNSGQWLGWQGTDVEATVELDEAQPVKTVKVYLFHAPGSWIHRPDEIVFFTSADGKNFQQAGVITAKDMDLKNQSFSVEMPVNKTAKAIRILAKPTTIPQDDPGAGTYGWIFIDEIAVY